MVKETEFVCEYTSSYECPFVCSNESFINAFLGGGRPCFLCIVRDAFACGRHEEEKSNIEYLRKQLKRTDMTEKERSEILKRITDYIRKMR